MPCPAGFCGIVTGCGVLNGLARDGCVRGRELRALGIPPPGLVSDGPGSFGEWNTSSPTEPATQACDHTDPCQVRGWGLPVLEGCSVTTALAACHQTGSCSAVVLSLLEDVQNCG